jgi:serine/threonine-protein kinase
LLAPQGEAGAASDSGASTKPIAKASSKGRVVFSKGWRGIRLALTMVGAMAILGVLIKRWVGPVSIRVANNDGDSLVLDGANVELVHQKKHGHSGPGKYPANTDAELFASGTWQETPGGRGELAVDFEDGNEEINAHAGTWKLEDGKLKATQAGSETEEDKLIPRAYVAHRYFSSDDFTAQVDMTLRALEDDFPVEENGQQFGELAFRIKDLKVSVFALEHVGMRLLWRYPAADGSEITGSSASDPENVQEDERPVPPNGTTFTVKLSLKRRGAGTEVEALLNEQRFAKKLLPKLHSKVGKVALGCRNLHCEFDNLRASGKLESRPPASEQPRAAAESE